tara:strand:+ start:58238 stop:59050 length:813 start_codon:yes stop_codon:yes gene_type:complete
MRFQISSFNIRCYGFGGEYDGRAGDEHRDEALRDVIERFLISSDVIVFQEICQVDRLHKILPKDFEYVTYAHDYPRHQFVVVAYKNKYLMVDPYRNHHAIDGVVVNPKTSRPGFYGLLQDRETKVNVAHIVGAHLKSGRHHTMTRLDQWEVIGKFCEGLSDEIPVFIAGDLNTQAMVFTGREKPDIVMFDELSKKFNFTRLENHQSTYKTQWETHQLDHIYYRGQVKALNELWVINVDEVFDSTMDQAALKLYYEWISDHLPIKGEFEIG